MTPPLLYLAGAAALGAASFFLGGCNDNKNEGIKLHSDEEDKTTYRLDDPLQVPFDLSKITLDKPIPLRADLFKAHVSSLSDTFGEPDNSKAVPHYQDPESHVTVTKPSTDQAKIEIIVVHDENDNPEDGRSYSKSTFLLKHGTPPYRPWADAQWSITRIGWGKEDNGKYPPPPPPKIGSKEFHQWLAAKAAQGSETPNRPLTSYNPLLFTPLFPLFIDWEGSGQFSVNPQNQLSFWNQVLRPNIENPPTPPAK